MTTEPRSAADLARAFRDQIDRLRRSASIFDHGSVDVRRQESFNLAAGISILVHDRGQSRALLGQLGLLDRLRIESWARSRPGNLLSEHALVILGSDGEYQPRSSLPPRPGEQRPVLPFADWWAEPVVVFDDPDPSESDDALETTRLALTRGYIVMNVRDKDGGSHVDPDLMADYAWLSRENALGWQMIDGDPPSSPPVPAGNPVPATLRQIWFELDAAIAEAPAS